MKKLLILALVTFMTGCTTGIEGTGIDLTTPDSVTVSEQGLQAAIDSMEASILETKANGGDTTLLEAELAALKASLASLQADKTVEELVSEEPIVVLTRQREELIAEIERLEKEIKDLNIVTEKLSTLQEQASSYEDELASLLQSLAIAKSVDEYYLELTSNIETSNTTINALQIELSQLETALIDLPALELQLTELDADILIKETMLNDITNVGVLVDQLQVEKETLLQAELDKQAEIDALAAGDDATTLEQELATIQTQLQTVTDQLTPMEEQLSIAAANQLDQASLTLELEVLQTKWNVLQDSVLTNQTIISDADTTGRTVAVLENLIIEEESSLALLETELQAVLDTMQTLLDLGRDTDTLTTKYNALDSEYRLLLVDVRSLEIVLKSKLESGEDLDSLTKALEQAQMDLARVVEDIRLIEAEEIRVQVYAKEELVQLHEELANLDTQISDIQDLMATASALESTLEKLTQKAADLETAQADLEGNLTYALEMEQTLETLRTDALALQTVLDAKTAEVLTLAHGAEKTALEEEIALLTSDLAQKQLEIGEQLLLIENLSAEQLDSLSLSASKVSLSEGYSAVMSDLEAVSTAIASQSENGASVEQYTAEIEELNSKRDAVIAQIQELESILMELESDPYKELNLLNKHIANLTIERDRFVETIDASLRIEDELVKLNAEILDLNLRILSQETLIAEASVLDQDLHRVSQEQASILIQIKAVETAIASANTNGEDTTSLESALSSLNDSYQVLVTEYTLLIQEQEAREVAGTDVASLNVVLDELNASLNTLQVKHDEIQAKLEQLASNGKDVFSLEQEKQTIEVEIAQIQVRVIQIEYKMLDVLDETNLEELLNRQALINTYIQTVQTTSSLQEDPTYYQDFLIILEQNQASIQEFIDLLQAPVEEPVETSELEQLRTRALELEQSILVLKGVIDDWNRINSEIKTLKSTQVRLNHSIQDVQDELADKLDDDEDSEDIAKLQEELQILEAKVAEIDGTVSIKVMSQQLLGDVAVLKAQLIQLELEYMNVLIEINRLESPVVVQTSTVSTSVQSTSISTSTDSTESASVEVSNDSSDDSSNDSDDDRDRSRRDEKKDREESDD